ncbi:MAG: 1-acyl-sn-glycerol-3-phosphate acyltransferase [Candidatus Babeliaceae bacterium]|jgi:1-acyl-sn-glycerol-3-phosphate acyltransferase
MTQREKVFELLRTLCTYVLVVCVGIVFLMPAMVLIVILPDSRRYDNRVLSWLIMMFFWSCTKILFMPIVVEGKENIPDKPVIIVANHQSVIDIVLVGSIFYNYPLIWFVLDYYAKKIAYGFFIKKMGIPVTRDDPHQAARALLRSIRFVTTGNHNLVIFPEGTRHVDGKVHDFFKGFAIIAKRSQCPVVPVYMPYNYRVYPPYSFLAHRHEIVVVIGKPIYYEPDDTDETFAQKVYTWFLTEQNRYD